MSPLLLAMTASAMAASLVIHLQLVHRIGRPWRVHEQVEKENPALLLMLREVLTSAPEA